LRSGVEPTEALKKELSDHVAMKIGGIARPEKVFFTAELPQDAQRQDHAPIAPGYR